MNVRQFQQRALHVSIEGLPSSGKTRILQILGENSPLVRTITDALPIGENVGGSNLVEQYRNGEAGAAFQLITLHIANFAKRANSSVNRIQIEENSLIGTYKTLVRYCSDSGNLINSEKLILENTYSILSGNLIPPPNIFIYVKTPPEIVLQRLITNQKAGDVNETIQWVTKLHYCYEEWLQLRGTYDAPTFEIDGTLNEEELRREIDAIMERIQQYL